MIKYYDFIVDTNKKNKEAFNDSLPIGNGKIGAMIALNPLNDKIILNDETLWLGNKKRQRLNKASFKYLRLVQNALNNKEYLKAEKLEEIGMFANPKTCAIYTVGAELRLDSNLKYTNFKKFIDYNNGYVGMLGLEGKRIYYCPLNSNNINIMIENNIKSSIAISLDREKIYDEIISNNNSLLLSYKYNEEDILYIQAKAYSDGIIEYVGNKIIISDYKRLNVIIYINTTFRDKNALNMASHSLNDITLDDFINHKNKFSELFNRTYLKIDDKRMEEMYEMAKYLTISSSYNDSYPSNLQGIWNSDLYPAWDSKYTININTEMNYWPTLSFGLAESYTPLFKLLKKMNERGKIVAKEMYNANGAVTFHNTDIYGDSAPIDHYPKATIWPLGYAWMSLAVYEYYKFTSDLNFLKENYYLLHNACEFFYDTLILDEEGYYKISPSLSPENSFYYNNEICTVCDGCSMDSSILYDLFNAELSISKALKNELNEQKALNVLSHLRPLKISKYKTIMEWNSDFDEAEAGHRHISQLYALFPSRRLNDELKEYAYNTIKRRLENGGGHTGWSKAWIMCMLARLNRADDFYKCFNEFIETSCTKTLLDLHPPFQIDGNFGVAQAINEMLYSFDGYNLYIAQALPKNIKNVQFKCYLKKDVILYLNIIDGKIETIKIDGNIDVNIINCIEKNKGLF